MRITLARIGCHETVKYAVSELSHYLKRIDPTLFVDIRAYSSYQPDVKGVIWVGEDASFSERMPKVKNAALDDAILIEVVKNEGVIAGNNPRATLIAAYRFLRELGCAWVRASSDGEIIPEYTMTPITLSVNEAASYRHRAVCIEGSVAFEHIIEMIKWIPRAGMNGYYIQFFLPYVFFNRWYTHRNNPYYKAEDNFDEDAVRAMVEVIKEEIALRSLLYHAIGHGWTSGPLGFDTTGWKTEDSALIPDEKRVLIAQLDGERAFLKGVPMNTNLCYSNPEARRLMTDAVADYCVSHPEVSYVHFWLADYPNSFCECENCRDTLPADHYVMMLNDIDEKLSARGCDTKVVFLVYYDLLWAPEREKIKNPDRFTAMFAPITRSYLQSFKTEDLSCDKVAPFVRNKLVIPQNVAENVAHLARWQKASGVEDGFDFDYHLMWDHHRDIGYFNCAKTLFDDMQSLERIGLNGMVSCQLTRVAFPSALPMQMMADALWDKTCDFEEKSDEYFLSAFGSDGLAVKEYLRTLSRLFDQECTRHMKSPVSKENAAALRIAEGTITDFMQVIEKNVSEIVDANLRASWEYLGEHARLVKKLATALKHRAEGGLPEECQALAEELMNDCRALEYKTNKVFDAFYFSYIIEAVLLR